MQRNCGVLAYDKLVGELNGRANNISMNTLAKLAQDNEFILYPMKIPIDRLEDVSFPAIVYTERHFELWDKIQSNPIVFSRDYAYVLGHVPIYELVMGEQEAKKIRGSDIKQMFTPPKSKDPWTAMTAGSTGGWAGWANAPIVRAGATLAAGAINPAFGAAVGAFQAYPGYKKPIGEQILKTGIGATAGYLGGKGMQSLAGVGKAGKGGFQAAYDWLGGLGKAAPVAGAALAPAGAGVSKPAVGGMPTGYATPEAAIAAGPRAFGAGAPMAAGLTGPAAVAPVTPAAGAGFWDKGVGKFLKTGLMTTAAGKAAEMLAGGAPEFDMPAEVEQYRQTIGQSLTEVGKLGREEIQRVLSSPFGQLIPTGEDSAYVEASMRRLEESAERRKEGITRTYNAYGRLYSSEHMEELSNIDRELDFARQDLEAKLTFEKTQIEAQYRVQALAMSLGVDEQTAQDLAGITQLAVEEAAIKYGLDVAEVQNIRDMIGLAMWPEGV